MIQPCDQSSHMTERPLKRTCSATPDADGPVKRSVTMSMPQLTELLPMDLWLYEFARRLFEARWDAYRAGGNATTAESPERPPMGFADDVGNAKYLLDEELG